MVSGIGPDFKETWALAEELGIKDRVDFPGEAAYAVAHERYALGDIFLSPTYAEGFSNTILEAMACGLPIVSTDSVGVVDCITDGVNGLLVAPGDVAACTEATRRLLTDKDLRVRLAERAYRDVQEKYSWPVVARQIEELYTALLDRPVDVRWTSLIDVHLPVAAADLSCRFRTAPQLL